MAVAAGLDSRVLGEPQILGQVTEAYMQAVEARAAGPLLDLLFRSAIRAGKRARRETAISSNPASISSVAIALAQEIAGDLRRRRILVVGAGTMAELALDALRKRGLTRVAIANRSAACRAAHSRARRAGYWAGRAAGGPVTGRRRH